MVCQTGTANFAPTGPLDQSGPPPDVVPNIPVGPELKQTFTFDFRWKFPECLATRKVRLHPRLVFKTNLEEHGHVTFPSLAPLHSFCFEF